MAERFVHQTLSAQARALLPYLINLIGGANANVGNADTVDNLHASTSPTGGQLLALDGTGKFPASVLPVFADAQFLTLATNTGLASERVLVAGAGLALADGGANGNATLSVNASNGLTLSGDDVILASSVAGAGLAYSGGVLSIGAGDTSITVNADSIQVALAATSGLAVSSGLLIADSIAGAGLTIASKVLAVASGNAGIVVGADAITLTLPSPSGLEIAAGGLQIADALAGAGLTITSKVLAVGAGLGITVNADDVALTTPGTLTGGTTNSSTGSHTHAITTGNAAANSVNLAAPSSSGTAIALAAHTHSIDQGIIPTWTGQHTFQANPVFSTGGDPVFYLATSGTTYRFIQVITSLTSATASGIKVGGLLAASDYNYASPTAGNAIISGTLGVGTATLNAGVDLYVSTFRLGNSLTKYLEMYTTGGGIDINAVGGTLFVNYARGQAVDMLNGYLTVATGGNVGVNVATASARLHVESATEQLRLGYNTTIYSTFTVASNGVTTLATTGGASNNLELQPGGDLILDPAGNDVLPATNYDINLGSPTKKWLSIHAAELWIETLVAQDVISTIGGRILVTPTTILTRDLGSADTTIYVKHNQMSSGDIIVMQRANLTGTPLQQLEFLQITSGPTTITGTPPNTEYSYTATRNLDGTGANNWYAGDALANTGTTGSGFHDLYSLGSIKGSPVEFIYNYDDSLGTFSADFSQSSTFSPFPSVPALNDCIYFGLAGATWKNLYFYVSVARVAAVTLTWEFWNGATWTTMTTTEATGWSATGLTQTLWSAAAQTGWTTTTVNGQSAYWVRCRISAFTSWTTSPVFSQRRVYYNKMQWGPTHVMWKRNSATFDDITEHYAAGNLNSLYDYSTNTFGVAVGRYASGYPWIGIDETSGLRIMYYNTQMAQWDTFGNILVGQQASGQGNVSISADALQLRTNTTVKINLQTDGDLFVGSDTAAADTTAFAIFNGAQTYNSEAGFVAGDLLIGSNSASKPNVFWDNDAGILHFRSGTTSRVAIDAAGGIRVGVEQAAQGNVLISGGGLALRTNTTAKINLETDGDVFIGSDISAANTTALAIFNNAQTYNGEAGFAAGDILIGSNSAGKPNLFWDASAGELNFRVATTTKILIDTAGVITIGTAATENVYVTSTAVQIRDATTVLTEIAGGSITVGATATEHVLISGSAIQMKDATTVLFDVSGGNVTMGQVALNQGNAYWNNSNKRLEFRGSTGGTVVQAYVDTTGAITAGGGNAVLDTDGLRITPQATPTTSAMIRFFTVGDSVYTAAIYANQDAVTPANDAAYFERNAHDGTGTATRLQLSNQAVQVNHRFFPGSGGVSQATNYITGDADGIGINTTNPAYPLDVNGGTRVSGGLNVGTATGAATGQIKASSSVLASQPAARVYNNANLGIDTATWTALTFNSERFDTDTIHDTVTSNSRLTCRTGGKYLIHGQARFAANTTGIRNLAIRLNGATYLAIKQIDPTSGGQETIMDIATIYALAVNDYVELLAFQSSGGSLNVEVASNYSPEFAMAYCSD